MVLTVTEQNPKPTVEEAFRESLKDLITVARVMTHHCKTVEEMVGMIELATENDGQLRMLLDICTRKK